jgi:DNA-binding transcriptional LysR family regulator
MRRSGERRRTIELPNHMGVMHSAQPNFAALNAFAAVARHRSFARAAAELGLSRSALSHAVRSLEEQLGTRLLHRTTRSVAPTEAGHRLLQRIAPAMADIGDALQEAAAGPGQVRGVLRLNVPRLGAALALAPKIAAFAAAHPAVHMEVTVEDGTADIVAGGYDAGIRLGERLQGDMLAVPVSAPLRMAAVAAPGYLAHNAPPTTPEDLREHACLRYRYPSSGALYRWEFERDGRALEVEVEGPLTTGDQELLVRAALAGAGIAFTVEEYVAEHLAEGRLTRLLDAWCPPFPGLFLYWPSRRHVPPALRALIDALRVAAA